MSLVITISPALSNCFHRLKGYMDHLVYDTNDSAMPYFSEITINGTGASISEVITLTRNNDVILRVTASSGGTFSVVVPAYYGQTNTYQASGPSAGSSNILVFDIYHWLLVHYLFSLEFLDIMQQEGQAKQDLYVDQKVGDSLTTTGDPAYFETEVATYNTSKKALVDKMTLPIPSDYWGQDVKLAVKKAIEVSEKGPVTASLEALKVLYSGVNLGELFTFQWEYPIYWDLDVEKIPRAKGPSDRDKLVIPANKKVRRGHRFEVVTLPDSHKEVVFSGVSSGTYYWIYVDGTKDVDDTLQIQATTTQPIPGIASKTLNFAEVNVETDDADGTVTDIPYQKYVTLDPPVASISSTISLTDDTGSITGELINREILAIGRANTNGTLTVVYDYWKDITLLCVVRIGASDQIEELARIWTLPGHIRPSDSLEAEDLHIYMKFSSGMTESVETAVLSNIRDILMEMVPISVGFVPYININRDDQEYIIEDSIDWPGIWKGYRWLDAYVGPSERERYNENVDYRE